MKKYYRQLLILFLTSVALSVMILVVNFSWIFPSEPAGSVPAASDQISSSAADGNNSVSQKKTGAARALILYSRQDAVSCHYQENLADILTTLRMDWDSVTLDHTDAVSYPEYDLVILASGRIEEELADPLTRLLDYVRDGGRLFFGIVPQNQEEQFRSVYRQLGIVEYGNYVSYQSFTVQEELVPGMAGRTFSSEAFQDIGIAFTLETRARVYVTAETDEGNTIPLVWSYAYGEGSVTFYNGSGITGDYWKGFAAGCILTLFDTYLYPVINSLCLFIDDFPSPQYESSSDVTQTEYNRTVKEFYRDIWWPDMQAAAQKYGDLYTGLMIATYNDITDPENFTYEAPSMEQYYGNSLRKSGGEIGAHGYNHQSLALDGQIPDELGYSSWASGADMQASVEELLAISDSLFPGVTLTSYVPPSNYLSEEGREAVTAAMENLKVISGVYTNEGEEGSVYTQSFGVASDGIVEFPRISSGMMPESYDEFSYLNGMGLYGVFSHFIHPDDVFDEERSRNQNWETLYDSYCRMMEDLHETYPWLRSLTVSDAADAVRIWDALYIETTQTEEGLTGTCANFSGEACFYLKTEKLPLAADKSCTIVPVSDAETPSYYFVTVNEPDFTIKLVEP